MTADPLAEKLLNMALRGDKWERIVQTAREHLAGEVPPEAVMWALDTARNEGCGRDGAKEAAAVVLRAAGRETP